MTYHPTTAFANEYGHDTLCMWPYRPCHVVCDHILLWESRKFSCPFSERLYVLAQEGAEDESAGSTAYGSWFGLFRDMRAILREDEQGFVYVDVYASTDELQEVWQDVLEHTDY